MTNALVKPVFTVALYKKKEGEEREEERGKFIQIYYKLRKKKKKELPTSPMYLSFLAIQC